MLKEKNIEYGVFISESTQGHQEVHDIRKKGQVYSYVTPLNHTTRETYNGNLFTKDFLETGRNTERFQRRINNKALYGEFQHPTRDNPERYTQVYDKEVSHRILDTWYEGDLLMGSIETATYSRGPDLAKKIESGSIPAKSLRAVGKVKKTPNGKERKLTIITWDNVFDASERAAWANTNSFKVKHPRDRGDGNDVAKELFIESKSIDEVGGIFHEIDKDVQFIGESLNGFQPDKIIKTPDNDIVGYYSESVTVQRKIKNKLSRELDEFMRS